MMKFQKRIYQILIAFCALVGLSMSSVVNAEIKHVFELFTSQSCYSCPPAEKLLGKIIKKNKDVLCLEFHVDYWDTLHYGSHGQWKDPYSSAAYTKRQRDYNSLSLEGRTGVYTPQMVVDGRYAFVGSQTPRAQMQIMKKSKFELTATAEINDAGEVTVQVDGEHENPADVWLITYDKKNTTLVSTGENHGKLLDNYNVVREMKSIGMWNGKKLEISAELGELTDNQNCAVIVQQFNSSRQTIKGPILGAANCNKI